MDLLRFTTCGNVDDGKSTLIGRLLHDSKAILEDQLAAIKRASDRRGDDYLNLALLTDGLRAEQEQGITIDVAYRYFATPRRRFIIADTPGHVQYTRNMVTGASTANVAVVLVDARKGIVEQTRRHCFIASLLRIPHLVICVNKMDLVGFSEEVFENIRADFLDFSGKVAIQDITFIPVSALEGDNVVTPSDRMPWFRGRSLLNHLEDLHIAGDVNHIDCRLPIQLVIRPQAAQSKELHDYRGYAGTLLSGTLKKGDDVVALPSGFATRVKSIELGGRELERAVAPMAVTVQLEDEIDVSRGDMITRALNQPEVSQDINAMVCWFDKDALVEGGKYTLFHTTNQVRAIVKSIDYKIDINTLQRVEDKTVGMNDIARIAIRTNKPIFHDIYQRNRGTGSFVLIDDRTNATVGACMIV